MLDQVLGDFSYASHPHSLHAWLPLPEPWRGEAFVSEARLQNVAVTPAEAFVVGPQPAPTAIRISVAATRTADQLRAGADHPGRSAAA